MHQHNHTEPLYTGQQREAHTARNHGPTRPKDLPVYGSLSDDKLLELQDALDELHTRDIAFVRRVNIIQNRHVPPLGNKYGRKYGFEDAAMVCALSALGVTQYGIQKLFKQLHPEKGEPAPCTIKAMRCGDSYKDLRDKPGFWQRVEHLRAFFEPAIMAMPNWRPSAEALREAQAAKAGTFYRGGRR